MKAEKQAFWASLILHLAVLFALFFSVLLQLLRPKEKPHVFEMVEPPSAAAAQPSARPEPAPAPDIPDIKPMETIPDPVVPPPAPKPAPQPKPPPPPQKLGSYADFIKQNPIRETPTRRPAPSRSVEVPKIDTAKVRENLQSLLTQSDYEQVSRMSPEEQSALQRYGARLKATLDRAWIKPPNLSGLQLVAQVTFQVSASGTIGGVRLNPSSGNPEFDASVLAAFRKVATAGPTPTGQSHNFTMRFKME